MTTPFGELVEQVGTTENDYLFTGQQFDELTGLYNLRARHYDPTMGRFISQDTYPYNFENPVELNRYVYTGNNPINLTDARGLNAAPNYSFTKKPSLNVVSQAQTKIIRFPGGWHTRNPRRLAAKVILPVMVPLIDFLTDLIETLLFPNEIPDNPTPDIPDISNPNTPDIPPPPSDSSPNPGNPPDPNNPPVPDSPPEPEPDPDDNDDDKIFYYAEVYYPSPSRSTVNISNDMSPYFGIIGVPDVEKAMQDAQSKYNTDPYPPFSYFLEGRKFESERTIYWASRSYLIDAHPSRIAVDFTIRPIGTISFVQAKWTQATQISKSSLQTFFESVENNPSGSHLLESNLITGATEDMLIKEGGVRLLPFMYP